MMIFLHSVKFLTEWWHLMQSTKSLIFFSVVNVFREQCFDIKI